jgi:flagellar motor switch protein FliN/FliY
LLGESTDIDPNNIELTDIHMSAMNEVMNQMVGSSATSLADILNRMVNISTPTTKRLELEGEPIIGSFDNPDEPFVKISFSMDIEDLLSSEIMQIMSLDLAKEMVNDIIKGMGEEETTAAPEPAPVVEPQPAAQQPQPQAGSAAMQPQQPYAQPYQQQPYPQQPMMQQPYPQQMMEPATHNVIMPTQNVNVQEAQFPSFNAPERVEGVENLNMILDVPMHVTVELGKTKQKIKDILAYNMGSVIVLDKVAGEAVDILVNGKRIGKGEVVVIDDNYGVRITEIHSFTAEELL